MNEYLEFAKELAQEAGAIMKSYFRAEVQAHYKEDNTIVTIADEEINRIVIDRITKKYPDHPVIGEEASVPGSSEYAWICDPIDGTNPFAKGIPISTFSLALAKDGKPIVGVINDPFTDSLFWASLGQGAFVNETPLKVSDRKIGNHIGGQSVIHEDWWPKAEWNIATPIHKLQMETGAYKLSIGSVVHAATLVAEGKFEAAVFAGGKGKNVDIAAAKIIVEEAGGKVTDLFGDEQRYDESIKGAIISNGVCHQQILDAFKGQL